jgi:hypothetical protein
MGQDLQAAVDSVKELKDKSYVVWSRPGVPAGYITRDRLLNPTNSLTSSLIDAWVIPAPVAVAPDISAGQLYSLMHQHKLPIVLVFDQTHYLGTVTWEKVASLLR